MARPARIEFEGAFYHVMNRGNRREDIFLDTRDREIFYEILGNIESRYGIIVYVFVTIQRISTHYRYERTKAGDSPRNNIFNARRKPTPCF